MSWDIDINCDLGEGAGNDEKMMSLIHSCSIACGGHYGTAESINATIALAKKNGVKVGAHPSFPDPANFGREIMKMEVETLKSSIVEQVNRFKKLTNIAGLQMNHVKLHGALYNLACKDLELAKHVIDALLKVGTDFSIYAPEKSAIQIAGEAYFKIIPEVFIDRTYQNDGSLTPRSHSKAMLVNPEQAWQQIKNCYQNNSVHTINNELIPLIGKTYCIHGDSPSCIDILTFVNQKLRNV
jgi:UPF0271 protein